MATTSPAMTAAATSQDALHALLCEVLPSQGAWSDEEYPWLTDRCNRLIEFTDGHAKMHTSSTACMFGVRPPRHACSMDSPLT